MQTKPTLGFWQIWNMCFGFFGIQFGWTLQMNNMSAIYEYLGAAADAIPGLWLAAPMTGLLIQPIVGYLSDRTWHPRLGRRRPYFLIGAILSSSMLFIMPHSPTVWMAAGCLWILDSCINISMEPFRAFVADNLPEEQRAKGYSMQSMFIGGASFIAGFLPYILHHWLGVSNVKIGNQIPLNIIYSFYIGGVAFLLAVLYTVIKAKEYPPDAEQLELMSEKKSTSLARMIPEIMSSIKNMPPAMKNISLVQFLTWPGLFLMWFFYTPGVARQVFMAPSESDPLYTKGVEIAGITYSIENLVTFLFSFALPSLVMQWGKALTHTFCLFTGALGLISLYFVREPVYLFVAMSMVGIAWASILSMPYSILSSHLPKNKMGIYMGIFNFFIVIPEIIAALFFGYVMKYFLGDDRLAAVMIGGFLLAAAAIACYGLKKYEIASTNK